MRYFQKVNFFIGDIDKNTALPELAIFYESSDEHGYNFIDDIKKELSNLDTVYTSQTICPYTFFKEESIYLQETPNKTVYEAIEKCQLSAMNAFEAEADYGEEE
jgi:hypothetical protein